MRSDDNSTGTSRSRSGPSFMSFHPRARYRSPVRPISAGPFLKLLNATSIAFVSFREGAKAKNMKKKKKRKIKRWSSALRGTNLIIFINRSRSSCCRRGPLKVQGSAEHSRCPRDVGKVFAYPCITVTAGEPAACRETAMNGDEDWKKRTAGEE